MATCWQHKFKTLKERFHHLLQTEIFADCRFLVGTTSNQRLISGHKFVLVIGSPFFERMFYGSSPEKDDPILIPDIEPDAFKAMLHYIYSEEISILSFDNACDLYNVAKKYMLPGMVEYCKNFLVTHLSPKNACRAYEFAKLHGEARLMECSMEHIVAFTREVIKDSSFMDIKFSTLLDILDQNQLNIESEIDLCNCILKFANKCEEKDNTIDASAVVLEEIKVEPENSGSGEASTSTGICGNASNAADVLVKVDRSASASGNAGEATSSINIMDAKCNAMNKAMMRQATNKIRFLAMTPKQFVKGAARCKLLKQTEAFPILLKIVLPNINDCPMPEGFCQLIQRDQKQLKQCFVSAPKRYAKKQYNNSYESASRLTFKANTSIYLSGVCIDSFATVRIKNVYVSLQNMQGLKIACSSSLDYLIESMYKFTFDKPVFVYPNENYIIKVNNMEIDDRCVISTWDREIDCNDAKFKFLDVDLPNQKDFCSIINGFMFSKQ